MAELSIIVAIYNVEKYLRKCLDSLKYQTSDNYQVYCVNDGSTDNSREIILGYCKGDHPFILLDKQNGGLSDVRNYGLKHVNSKYVMFIDGDDYVEPNLVERCLDELHKNDLDMLVFNYDNIYLSNGNIIMNKPLIKEGIYNLKDNKEILAYTPNAAWNKAYKTSLFKYNNIEYPFGYRHQDLGTTPKLLLKSNKVGYINDVLYHYVIDRPNNITAQVDNKLYHIIDMSKEVMDYYKANGVFDEYKEEFEYLIKRNFIQSLRKAMTLKDSYFVNKFIDDVFKVNNDYFKDCKHKYNLIEEKGDDVYLSKIKCKMYYLIRKMRG